MGSSIYREVCHCGCDKLSHYRDPASGRRFSCLNRCDCKQYVDSRDPPPAPERKTRRYGHPDSCQCFDCKQLAIPEERKTDPWGLP